MDLFHENDLSGTVQWLPINGGLLTGHLSTTTLIVSLFAWPIVRIPIHQICTVQIVSSVFRPEIVITYMDARNAFKVMSLQSRQPEQWKNAFEQVGISTTKPVI